MVHQTSNNLPLGFDIPVLLLVFNRPDTTSLVFEAIRKVRPIKLYVAADGPRENWHGESRLCEETREIVKKVDWDCSVETLFRVKNLGCKIAVSSALGWFFANEEYGIVLEDDCLPSESFFEYCKELLIKYRFNERVMHIGGQHFLNNIETPQDSYYFTQYPHIWGWASWRRAWLKYDVDIQQMDKFNLQKLPNMFSSKKQRIHLKKHLYLTRIGKLNTWDYQWTYSILNNGGVAISPTKNLVVNLGFTNQNTHLFLKDSKRENLEHENISFPLKHPKSYNIQLNLDFLEYQNIYSKNCSRIRRIIRENGILNIIKYIINRFG